MKFRREKLEIGARFYTFISEDEYRIVTLVKINDDNSAQFMDEETFELETITKEKLDKDYTMLTNNKLWIVCNFKLKDEFKKGSYLISYDKNSSLWIYNNNINNFIMNYNLSYPYCLKLKIRMVVYKLMKKSVFDKLINYIIKLNNPEFEISEDDIENIWQEYFSYENESNDIIDFSKEAYRLNMDDIVENKAKIPDDIIDYAEDILGVPIYSYDPYEFDESINMNNVNMKHFFMYINDKYYLILYIIDARRETMQIQQDLRDNMDLVEFMLK